MSYPTFVFQNSSSAALKQAQLSGIHGTKGFVSVWLFKCSMPHFDLMRLFV